MKLINKLPVSYTHLEVYKRQLMFYYGGESDESRFQTSTAFLETYFANSKAPDLILHKGKFNSPVSYTHLDVYKRQVVS